MRSEFWWFQLFGICMTYGAMGLDHLLLGYTLDESVTPLVLIVTIVIVIPTASVTARRLHDIGWSGWVQLPVFAAYSTYLDIWLPNFSLSKIGMALLMIGGVFWLVMALFLIKDSQPQTNKYGHNPKSPDMGAVFN